MSDEPEEFEEPETMPWEDEATSAVDQPRTLTPERFAFGHF